MSPALSRSSGNSSARTPANRLSFRSASCTSLIVNEADRRACSNGCQCSLSHKNGVLCRRLCSTCAGIVGEASAASGVIGAESRGPLIISIQFLLISLRATSAITPNYRRTRAFRVGVLSYQRRSVSNRAWPYFARLPLLGCTGVPVGNRS